MSRRTVCPQCKRYRWIPLGLHPFCTSSCKREALTAKPKLPPGPLLVSCCVCPQTWNPRDPGVCWRSLDGRWWCRDTRACWIRRDQHRAEVAAMCRALDQVWDRLEAEGWRI